MRKTFFLSLLLVVSLICGTLSDEALDLSREEAKQLHALLLVGELQDFGERAGNPSAYLMAAELLLDYPSREQNRGRVTRLCGHARALGRDDELVQAWADRLESRVKKSIRGPRSNFLEVIGTLEGSQVLELPGSYRGVWLHDDGLQLEMLDHQGKTVKDASHATVLRLVNDTEEPSSYQLILLE